MWSTVPVVGPPRYGSPEHACRETARRIRLRRLEPVGEQVGVAFAEVCDELAGRRVDEARCRRSRPSGPSRCRSRAGARSLRRRVVPDVVFDALDAELVEFALQHRAESATGPPVEIDPADDFRRLLGHARCNDAGADVFPVGLHTRGAHGDVAGRGWQTGTMTTPESDSSVYLARLAKVRAAMAVSDIDTLLLSVGHDLPYLTGYTAMPLERLTMLVVPRDAGATMLIPALEAPRVRQVPGVFDLLPWGETQDPTAIVAGSLPAAGRVAVGDQMWARFLVELLPQLPGAEYTRAVDVVGPLRMSKDQAEIDALAAAGRGRRPDRRRTAARRDPARRAHRGRGLGTPRPTDPRGGPRQGQLRDRRRRRERGEPAPSRRIAGDPRERDRAVRLRRHDERLLLRHHALRVHR
jgi:hypothetical protein